MREIKFRAWDCDVRKMTNWKDLILEKSENEDRILIGYKKNKAITNFDHKMILMQSTGLKDRNGIDIYEGDIVRVTYEDGSTKGIDVGIGEVEFFMGYWNVTKIQFDLYCLNEFRNIEVVGNTYENMELLEV